MENSLGFNPIVNEKKPMLYFMIRKNETIEKYLIKLREIFRIK